MTPDNASFAITAYTLAGIVYLAYSAILGARERSLRDKLSKLEGTSRS